MRNKQANQSKYKFGKYMRKKRWLSLWHQVDEVLALGPSTVLELGIGPGFFKALMSHCGIPVTTVDIDPELNPDHLASATDLPFADDSYECVCAFQMLEHLPYEESCRAFSEMVRVAQKHIVISLPDAKKIRPLSIQYAKSERVIFLIPRPRISPRPHKFNGQHFWEINKKGYLLPKIIGDFTRHHKIRIVNTYRVKENPYHRFFIFKKELTPPV